VLTVFDTVTTAAEECSIMSCAKSQKHFSGGSLQSLAVAAAADAQSVNDS